MNYQASIKNNYLLRNGSSSHLMVYLSNNNVIELPAYDGSYTFFNTSYYVANYVNNYVNNVDGYVIAYSYTANSNTYLVCTNRLDFVFFDNQTSRSYDIVSGIFSENQLFSNYTTDYNYMSTNGASLENFMDYYVTNYDVTLNPSPLSGLSYKSIFDYTSIDNESGDVDLFTARGENTTYYKQGFVISGNSSAGGAGLTFSTGQTVGASYALGFDSGYSNGLANGRVSGYDDGYQDGLNAGNATTTQSDAFDYIGSAFNAVGNLLAIEVLPHVTIGLCFSIPVVFILIMTIFKLIRK